MMTGMHRDPHSHKGENGKIAVIGGSATIHGAPIFSALAAEASGVDLVFLVVPQRHATVAKMSSLNFQVHPMGGDDLDQKDMDDLLEMLATVDVAIIGPGLSRTPPALKMLRELVRSCPCPMVLDASALQSWTLEAARGKTAIVTPHLGELERMGIDPEHIGDFAKDSGTIIHAKGPTDRIAGIDGTVREVRGGNAGLTVGGTGDALAGLIGGLLAQGCDAMDACETASTAIKRAGESLIERQATYTTRDVIAEIPCVMKTL
jgi:NAD(P)H-hydrate epimerase